MLGNIDFTLHESPIFSIDGTFPVRVPAKTLEVPPSRGIDRRNATEHKDMAPIVVNVFIASPFLSLRSWHSRGAII